ncbi:MAG: hypothetical protein IPG95_12175 [Saprospiraceae bacterium]|nr:hypothetical protein [Saprospiraceae bacterium]
MKKIGLKICIFCIFISAVISCAEEKIDNSYYSVTLKPTKDDTLKMEKLRLNLVAQSLLNTDWLANFANLQALKDSGVTYLANNNDQFELKEQLYSEGDPAYFATWSEEIESNLNKIKDTDIKAWKASKFGIKDTTLLKTVQIGGKLVNIKEEVASLFDPSNHSCSLPSKVLSKIKELNKKAKKNWTPPFITTLLNKLPSDQALLYSDSDISDVMHTFQVKTVGANSIEYYRTVSTASTYKNFEYEKFMLLGKSNFLYTLDCSGYLSAAMEFTGAVPLTTEVKSSANSALTTKSSFFVGGGVLVSPLAGAYFGRTSLEMDTSLRIHLLELLTSFPGINDADTIRFNNNYKAIWSSSKGSHGFNGEANFKVNASLSFGVASIAGQTEGNTKLSRNSTFSNFTTYILPPDSEENLPVIKFGMLKAELTKLKGR